MCEIGFLLELVCWKLSVIRAFRGRLVVRQVGLPILGCAVALTAGCSSMGSNQTMPVMHPTTPPAVAPSNTQAVAPEFQTPKWELAVPDRPEVDLWVRRFSQDKHKSFQTQLDRARFYVVPVQQIFEERGLPKDIVFVALVESGFSPTAKSHASAVGMWQFISSTGKRFGLEQNQWVDERRHPFKSAHAAAGYLSFLYDMFGSWPLALAAYNCGENAVQGAQTKTGLRSFWELAEGRYLPSETCDYVPKVLATVKLIRDPRHYGFHFDDKYYVQRHETVPVPGGVKLAVIEKKTGVPRASLEDCNPELCRPETPPWCSSYELCVPVGTRELVENAIAEGGLKEDKLALRAPTAKAKEPASPRIAAARSCKVGPGETWFSLSKKYRCSAQALALLNGTTPSHVLKAGQTLKVPNGEALAVVATVQKKGNASRPVVTAQPSGKKTGTTGPVATAQSSGKKAAGPAQKSSPAIHYPIRQGDTLWSIAQKYSVPVEVLCAKNEMKPNQRLIPGQLLTIDGSKQESARRGK
jgi:membrane-bound lytic murein transglycosylase D